MRLNVYHHEVPFMAERCEHVTKVVDGLTFHGIRFYTEAPLMHRPDDDDSSAITIWVPWTMCKGNDVEGLRTIATAILTFCDEVERG